MFQVVEVCGTEIFAAWLVTCPCYREYKELEKMCKNNADRARAEGGSDLDLPCDMTMGQVEAWTSIERKLGEMDALAWVAISLVRSRIGIPLEVITDLTATFQRMEGSLRELDIEYKRKRGLKSIWGK